MKKTSKLLPVQNLGLFDRTIRVLLGIGMLGGVAINIEMGANLVTMVHAVVALLAVYPFLTSILGWDPIYSSVGARSCSLEGGKNSCGTLPYEIDAALGHNPVPDRDFDHSLAGSHHNKKQKAA